MSSESKVTSHDRGISYAMLIFIGGVILYIFWYYNATEVRDAVRWVRYAQMWVMSWFISDDYKFIFEGVEYNWRDSYEAVRNVRADKIDYTLLSFIGAMSMYPLRWLYAGILLIMGLWAAMYGPGTQFRSVLGLEGLISRQARNFPVIFPFVKFNPSKMPPRPPGSPVPAELPLFAEALGPEEWLAYNSIPAPNGRLDEEAAEAAFAKQLGQRWRGPDALKPHQQILLAIFCLKASRKRKDADDMLGRIAKCWAQSGLALSKDRTLVRDARRILRNQKLSGKTLSQCNRHAYETTALLRALFFARSEGGVLAPATFVWLRGHDRALWYPLNNLGRHSFHPEAMGAMSHFKAERLTQRPIPVPKVMDGVKMMSEYMASIRARPIPPLDYKGSKKKGIKMAR